MKYNTSHYAHHHTENDGCFACDCTVYLLPLPLLSIRAEVKVVRVTGTQVKGEKVVVGVEEVAGVEMSKGE